MWLQYKFPETGTVFSQPGRNCLSIRFIVCLSLRPAAAQAVAHLVHGTEHLSGTFCPGCYHIFWFPIDHTCPSPAEAIVFCAMTPTSLCGTYGSSSQSVSSADSASPTAFAAPSIWPGFVAPTTGAVTLVRSQADLCHGNPFFLCQTGGSVDNHSIGLCCGVIF